MLFLRQAARKFARNLLDYGVRTALGKAAATVLSIVYEHKVCRIYRRNVLANGLPADGRRLSSLKITVMDRDHPDVDAARQIEQMEEWLEGKLEGRLRDRGICVVAQDGRTVTGFSLIAFSRAQLELVRQIRALADDEAWSEQITVRRQYRRRGVGTALRLRTFQELRKRGIKWLYGGTLSSNTGSLAFTRTLGFTEIEDVHYRRFLGTVSTFTVKRAR